MSRELRSLGLAGAGAVPDAGRKEFLETSCVWLRSHVAYSRVIEPRRRERRLAADSLDGRPLSLMTGLLRLA